MKTRSQILELAARREYDLAVIGGGILGAGVAQDAASRGLSVIIVEKGDFACAASGQSAKLIDGGLHYLERGQVRWAQQITTEQSLLEQLAPHLVREQSFVLPLLSERPLLGLKATAGLFLYDYLATSTGKPRHKRLNAHEVVDAVPALAQSKVGGGLQFVDAITDDARLVIEVIKSAAAAGAHALNYMEVTAIVRKDNKTWELTCHNRYSGKRATFSAKACVNAAGIASDAVSQLVDPNWKKRFEQTRAVRFILPSSAYETNTAFYLPLDKGEYVFVIPWQRALIAGTTAARSVTNTNGARSVTDEIEYVLSILNAYNAHRKVVRTDVIAAWVEERLENKHPDGSQSSNGSRSNLAEKGFFPNFTGAQVLGSKQWRLSSGVAGVFDCAKGMVGVVSDTMTSYRYLARAAVDRLLQIDPGLAHAAVSPSRTERMMLGGWFDKQDFLTVTALIAARARKMSIEPSTIDHLVATYGKEAQQVLDLVEEQPYLNQRICPDFPPILAEVPYSVANEMAVSLEDLLYRRIRLGQLHHRQCLDAATKVARLVQEILGWEGKRIDAEIDALALKLAILDKEPQPA
jgi:glycerol-3-phosphate dehydrogenase